MMNNLNLNRQNDLITRRQTYVLNRKLITFHSNDRDIKKWPHANHFELELPETLSNIQSLRVAQTCFPMKFYTFSNEYQNTKLSFKIIPQLRNDAYTSTYDTLKQYRNNIYTIEIQEGTYTPDQICREIESKMNREVYDFLIAKGLKEVEAKYNYFTVTFDSVAQKIFFGNTLDNFSLLFDKKETYTSLSKCNQPNIAECQQKTVWNQYTNWGLPYYLGFKKSKYPGCEIEKPFIFDYRVAGTGNGESIWLSPDINHTSQKAFYVEAPKVACLNGDTVMYMMVDKFNSMGEIVPYSESTTNMYNNDYNGTVNAAFEKIPINTMVDENQTFNSKGNGLENISHYDVPIETIRKLKFTFRFHDGRLVDFQDCDFNFTISFMCIHDEIPREYEMRIPASYSV
jgi:hypothetical protein